MSGQLVAGSIVGKALVTAAIGVLDSFVLYVGTMTPWAFVHRWVLMAVGIASGAVWMFSIMRRAIG